MSTTYTTRAKLGKPADGDTGWSTVLRANLDALDAMPAVGGLAVTAHEIPSTTLNVAVAAGTYRGLNGQPATYAGAASQAVSASATTYLWLNSSGALTTGASLPTNAPIIPLASVVAGSSTITGITDLRVPFPMIFAQATGGALAAGSSYTATEQGMINTMWTQLRALGFLS